MHLSLIFNFSPELEKCSSLRQSCSSALSVEQIVHVKPTQHQQLSHVACLETDGADIFGSFAQMFTNFLLEGLEMIK